MESIITEKFWGVYVILMYLPSCKVSTVMDSEDGPGSTVTACMDS